MASLNKCTFIGFLGADPDTKYLPSGDAITTISIACTETWKDKQTGEKKESTEWVRVTFFSKLAEIAGQYLKKGSQVYVEGSLRTRKYTDKDGVEKYATDIRADEMKMLGGRPGGGSEQADNSGYGAPQSAPAQRSAPQQSAPRQQAGQASGFPDMDDIPFDQIPRKSLLSI